MYGFTGRKSFPLEYEDRIDLTLVINKYQNTKW